MTIQQYFNRNFSKNINEYDTIQIFWQVYLCNIEIYCHTSAEYFEQFLKSVSQFASHKQNNNTLYLPVGQAISRSKLAYLKIYNNNKIQIIIIN